MGKRTTSDVSAKRISNVGILACQYADGIQLKILNGDDTVNFGVIYENAVAQELIAHGFDDLFYYNSKKMGEVDFAVEMSGNVLPIEVKSGKDCARHRALNNIMDCDEYNIPTAIVLCSDNVSTKGNILYAPIYMTMFICKNETQYVQFKIDLSGLSSDQHTYNDN